MRIYALQKGPCSFLKLHISPWEIPSVFLLCSPLSWRPFSFPHRQLHPHLHPGPLPSLSSTGGPIWAPPLASLPLLHQATARRGASRRWAAGGAARLVRSAGGRRRVDVLARAGDSARVSAGASSAARAARALGIQAGGRQRLR
jgi:hypothetical protein